MSCERLWTTLGDDASGVSSPELESHLSGCQPCRAVLAAERALLDRIDGELQDSLEMQPSLVFLPAARPATPPGPSAAGPCGSGRGWPVRGSL